MTNRLQKEIKKAKPFESAEQEAALNLARTAQFIAEPFEKLFKSFKLSGTQYNVLRILRGAGGPLHCGQIG
ncbi:MAG: MarR family transcriptional regulator, partial [Planctomycetes bacterium]|nr:MarR family transcriptional regulator [Planctomycetota bacterium]